MYDALNKDSYHIHVLQKYTARVDVDKIVRFNVSGSGSSNIVYICFNSPIV